MPIIYKVQIEPYTDRHLIAIPIDAEVIKVGQQEGSISVWYKTNDYGGNKLKRVGINVVPTGQEFGERVGSHLDSVLMSNGLVWHIFIEN